MRLGLGYGRHQGSLKIRLEFQSNIRREGNTIKSPLNSLVISSRIEKVLDVAVNLEDRIFVDHYKPEDYNSPQQTLSIISAPLTIYEATTNVFNYQRIEGDHCFLNLVKAESCHLISKAHCVSHETLKKYNANENNRLALSSIFHDFYDGKNSAIQLGSRSSFGPCCLE